MLEAVLVGADGGVGVIDHAQPVTCDRGEARRPLVVEGKLIGRIKEIPAPAADPESVSEIRFRLVGEISGDAKGEARGCPMAYAKTERGIDVVLLTEGMVVVI